MTDANIDHTGHFTAHNEEGTILHALGVSIRAGRRRLGLGVHELAFVSRVPFDTIVELEWHTCRDIDYLAVSRLSDALMMNLLDPASVRKALAPQ